MRMWQRGQHDPADARSDQAEPEQPHAQDGARSLPEGDAESVELQPVSGDPGPQAGQGDVLDALTGLESQLAQLRKAHVVQQQTAAELDQRREAIEQEQSQLESARADLERAEQDLQTAREGLEQEAMQAEQAATEAREAAERVREERVQLEELERGLEAREQAVNDAKEEADEQLRAELAEAERISNERHAAIAARTADVERLSAELAGARQRVEELESATHQLAERSSSAENETQSLRERAERAEQEARSLSEQMQRLGEEAEGVRAGLSEMESARQEAQARAEEAERLASERESALAELQGRAETGDGERAQLQSAIGSLTHERDEARAALESIRQDAAAGGQQADEIAVRLAEAEATIERMQSEMESAANASAALAERARSAEETASAAEEKYAKLERKAREIAGSLERRTERLRAAEQKVAALEAAGAEGDGSAGPVVADESNTRRRQRLLTQRDLLRGESGKIRRAAEALRQKFAEADRVLAQRAELRTAARAVVEAQKKLQRDRATTRAVWNIAGVAIACAAIGALSFSLVKQVVPGKYAAVATFAAESRGGEATPDELAGWREYHEQLIEDPRFIQAAAQRMQRRGLAELGDTAVLRAKMQRRLDLQPASEDTFQVQWTGEGSARTERELDTLLTVVLGEANATESASAGSEPIDRTQLMAGLVVFGVLATGCVFAGALLWRRMTKARDDFERELRVVAALGDIESVEPGA